MAKIVVMGAGIGGLSQVFELRRELGRAHDITLVGDSDDFEFTPSNPWVAVGWRKAEQVKVNLPEIMNKHGVEFSGVGVKRLHPDDHKLELNDGSSIDYDYLVIATGPKLAFEEVPGLGPHGGYTARSPISNSLPQTPARSSSAPRRWLPASARPTSTRSSSTPSSRSARFATRCPCIL